MIDDPTGAADVIAAFQRAASEPDPIFGLAEGFRIFLRTHGHGVLTDEMRQKLVLAIEIADRLMPFQKWMGVEPLRVLTAAWASPLDDEIRNSVGAQTAHLNVRIVANDLDSSCARIELGHGAYLRQPAVPAAPRQTSVH